MHSQRKNPYKGKENAHVYTVTYEYMYMYKQFICIAVHVLHVSMELHVVCI